MSEPPRLPELPEALVRAAQEASPTVRLVGFAWAVSQIELKPLKGMILPLEQQELQAFKEELQRGALDRAGAGEGG